MSTLFNFLAKPGINILGSKDQHLYKPFGGGARRRGGLAGGKGPGAGDGVGSGVQVGDATIVVHS